MRNSFKVTLLLTSLVFFAACSDSLVGPEVDANPLTALSSVQVTIQGPSQILSGSPKWYSVNYGWPTCTVEDVTAYDWSTTSSDGGIVIDNGSSVFVRSNGMEFTLEVELLCNGSVVASGSKLINAGTSAF